MNRLPLLKEVTLKSSTLQGAIRSYSPPSRAVALYGTNFHIDYKFPVDLIDSSEVRYAQFLYRLQEDVSAVKGKASPSEKLSYIKDFEKLQNMKLPVFWEREVDVTKSKEFQKNLHENFVFLMKWMQSNGDLGKISEVKQYFELLTNETSKKSKVNIFLPEMNITKEVQDAFVEKAKSLVKSEPSLSSRKNYQMEFNFCTDRTLESPQIPQAAMKPEKAITETPFYVEVSGRRINFEPLSIRKATQAKQKVDSKVDYSNIKAAKSLIKTTWDDGIETIVLSGYFEQLAKMDEDEQLHGV